MTLELAKRLAEKEGDDIKNRDNGCIELLYLDENEGGIAGIVFQSLSGYIKYKYQDIHMRKGVREKVAEKYRRPTNFPASWKYDYQVNEWLCTCTEEEFIRVYLEAVE